MLCTQVSTLRSVAAHSKPSELVTQDICAFLWVGVDVAACHIHCLLVAGFLLLLRRLVCSVAFNDCLIKPCERSYVCAFEHWHCQLVITSECI